MTEATEEATETLTRLIADVNAGRDVREAANKKNWRRLPHTPLPNKLRPMPRKTSTSKKRHLQVLKPS